jgi:hypothetical protein
MKSTQKYLVLILSAVVLVSGCTNDKAPGETEVFLQKLVGEWQLKSATRNDVAITSAFKGLAVTFKTDGTYVATPEILPFWPEAGTYENPVYDNNEFKVKRDDGITMTVESITDSSVTISMTIMTIGGRMQQVDGEVVFEFTKRN